MKISSLSLLAATGLALVVPAAAQFKMQTPAGEAPGPWVFGTIGVGKNPDKTVKTTALKGLAIKVGPNGEAAIAYDLDLCRMAGAWTGGKFTTPMNLMSRGDYPTAMGDVAFSTGEVAGFQVGDAKERWNDPRSEPFGPLPNVKFRGMYVNGDKTVLKWDVAGTEVLEMPGYVTNGKAGYLTRTFEISPSSNELAIAVASCESTASNLEREPTFSVQPGTIQRKLRPINRVGDGLKTDVTVYGEPEGSTWQRLGNALSLVIPPSKEVRRFQIALWVNVPEDAAKLVEAHVSLLPQEPKQFDSLKSLTKGGAAHWPESVTTKGEISANTAEPYVVDTIKLPETNPWNAPMFIGGFDFFPDGRAAVCTFHGDIFVVSGIDDKLGNVTWRRFASGLYHALGLKVVNNEIYVTCRDGIYCLRDLNKDGEADFYEVFNNDIKVTKSFHEFVFDLQTDRDGYFYFAKAGPVKNGGRGFDEIMEHHGTMLRVTPDGKKLEVIATGFRAPNGIGVGPNTELTSGDNEGTWTPVCKINWINQGGFYGVVDLAHRNPPPTDYDRPLCWLPKRLDNSSGSQVWVTSNKWGPWKDQMLHLSYGTCSLFGVFNEGVDIPDASDCCSHLIQGGVVQFPVKFQSGIMRARFNPVDGQLYVAGLRGWQTTGLKNGCLQRVRYTGAPVRMPIELHARKGGIEVKFTGSIDTQTAADPANWNVEVWNYIWSSAYGSPEISTLGDADKPTELGKDGKMQFTAAQMNKKGHDPLTVKSVRIGTDDRTVFLEIPDLKPVMQMSIKYQLKAADGGDIKGEIVNTIHALGAAE
ncbi:DUF6797 domain-containing protein [Verrucomicrobiota bacterium sgz303538]